jgi:fatty acid desaturase
MWRQQHVVGHHAYTNVEGLDPDIRVGSSDVRRVTGAQPWHAWHTLQHLYLGVMYGLLAFKSTYLDDFAALRSGDIGSVRLAPQTRTEAAVFWGGKATYAAYMLAVPMLWSHHSMGQLLALWALADAVTGWMLAFMFQVAHVVDDVAYPARDVATGRVPLGWAAGQVATTADFCHGSAFWTHVSGGLNYQVCAFHLLCKAARTEPRLLGTAQVVHHLFPGVCHCYYPALAPIVLRTAAEFGVPYKVYPTFGAAVAAHFRQLRSVGWGKQGVPSLATVG